MIRVKPTRDDFGRAVKPARLWLTARENPQAPPTQADASLPVAADWLSNLQPHTQVILHDARGSKRQIEIVDITREGCWGELYKTAYLTPNTALLIKDRKGRKRETRIAPFPAQEQAIKLVEGDVLILTKDQHTGHPATYDSFGEVLTLSLIHI